MKALNIGYGTCGVENVECIKNAINCGYRMIDTASHYYNEQVVGRAIKESDIDRRDLVLVTKLWYSDMGYDSALRAFEKSISQLGVDYIDLYLIHWPAAAPKYNDWEQVNYDTWKALESIYKSGRVKAIGTCNFMEKHFDALLNSCEITPMYNQIENHIGFYQKSVKEYCDRAGIQCIAWQPLGGSEILTCETIADMARKYKKTPAQICLRWNYQHGFIVIPKSCSEKRMKENMQFFDFVISDEDMQLLDSVPACGGQCAKVK